MPTTTTAVKTATTKAAAKKAPLKRTQSKLSFDPPAQNSKRVCLGDITAKFTAQELQDAEKEDIIAHVIALQEHISKVSSQSSTVKGPEEMTPEQLDSKVEIVRRMMVAGLVSQMKWKKSLKTGNSRLSYCAVVPNVAVFHALFKVPSDFKKKQIKMETSEFEKEVVKGRVYAKGPWRAQFQLASQNMTIKWDKEDLTFTVSGEYSA